MDRRRIITLSNGNRILLPRSVIINGEGYEYHHLLAVLENDDTNLLITGETGTGKETMADYVFDHTKRLKTKCERVSCAGWHRDFLYSELFGHTEGAFTGAKAKRTGLLMECNGGVLFLDEIGHLDKSLQANLLRVLAGDRKIRPLGADKPIGTTNVRIIAATNSDIRETLLPDLVARFDFSVGLPSLRTHPEEILWHAMEVLRPGLARGISGVLLKELFGMVVDNWPENVRGLRNYCKTRMILDRVEKQKVNNSTGIILDEGQIFNPFEPARWGCIAFAILGILEKMCLRDPRLFTMQSFLNTIDFLLALSEFQPDPLVSGRSVSIAKLVACFDKDNDLSEQECVLPSAFCFVEDGEPWPKSPTHYETCEIGTFPELLASMYRIVVVCQETVKGEGQNCSDVNDFTHKPSIDFLNHLNSLSLTLMDHLADAGKLHLPSIIHILDQLNVDQRDREIAKLCNKGHSASQIADKLKMAPSTVKEHLQHLRSFPELAALLPRSKSGRRKSDG